MRAIDGGVTLFENNFIFVGAINLARTQNRLPTSGNPARRCQDVIPTVHFQEFGAFERWTFFGLMKYNFALAQQLGTVWRHGADPQLMFDVRPGAGISVDQIRLAVVVPERAGINQTLAGVDQMRLGPLAGGMVGGDDVDAFVGHREKSRIFLHETAWRAPRCRSRAALRRNAGAAGS